MDILFVTSEIYPLIKTGGLGDVAHGLPLALRRHGLGVQVVLPAYRDALARAGEVRAVARFTVTACGKEYAVTIRAGELAAGVGLLLVDIPPLFDRPGNPYLDADGNDWWDNGERFGVFAMAAARLALGEGAVARADVVHCNDWQSALVPALLQQYCADAARRPPSVFTIHNLSYGGHFPYELFAALGLPSAWWHFSKMEFYGAFSMLKGGIVFADHVTTVSPGYVEEICREPGGFGLHSILSQRRAAGTLSGILNGIDTSVWNPARDPHLPYRYSVKRGRVAQKRRNKQQLLRQLGSGVAEDAPLLGFVGRLVEQKGIDLLLEILPALFDSSTANVVVVGCGMRQFERQLRALARAYPGRLLLYIGYREELAHLVEGGCDIFLMPSRFEPCGLNQMYSLAYGTPPVVHATGGLKDTVVDTTTATLADGSATGFVFAPFTATALRDAIERALALYARPRRWQQVQKNGMQCDFSWENSARPYIELYRRLRREHHEAIRSGRHD